jgi:uncharacterized protein
MKEILIEDIPQGGFTVTASEKDEWLSSLLNEALEGSYFPKNSASASIRIVRYEDNVTIDGGVEFSADRRCDRCLEAYSDMAQMKVHAVLVPTRVFQPKYSEEEIELVAEDMEFSAYEGDRFDLADVLLEQIVLALPMKRLCREDCAGLCQRCGKNLNEGMCGCKDSAIDPRWDALKGFSPRKRPVKGKKEKKVVKKGTKGKAKKTKGNRP